VLLNIREELLQRVGRTDSIARFGNLEGVVSRDPPIGVFNLEMAHVPPF